ncbi:hypothetical protein L345_16718, partial [Ophiophagus hannah]
MWVGHMSSCDWSVVPSFASQAACKGADLRRWLDTTLAEPNQIIEITFWQEDKEVLEIQWWYATGLDRFGPTGGKINQLRGERREKCRIGSPTRPCAFLFFILSADWRFRPQLVWGKLHAHIGCRCVRCVSIHTQSPNRLPIAIIRRKGIRETPRQAKKEEGREGSKERRKILGEREAKRRKEGRKGGREEGRITIN